MTGTKLSGYLDEDGTIRMVRMLSKGQGMRVVFVGDDEKPRYHVEIDSKAPLDFLLKSGSLGQERAKVPIDPTGDGEGEGEGQGSPPSLPEDPGSPVVPEHPTQDGSP